MNLVELLINYLENIFFFLLQLQPLILFFLLIPFVFAWYLIKFIIKRTREEKSSERLSKSFSTAIWKLWEAKTSRRMILYFFYFLLFMIGYRGIVGQSYVFMNPILFPSSGYKYFYWMLCSGGILAVSSVLGRLFYESNAVFE